VTVRNATTLPALAVAASAVAWGLWWIPVRTLAAAGLGGDWVSLAVYTLAAALLLPVAVARRARIAAGGIELLLIGLCLGVALTAWNRAVLTGEVVRVVLLFYLCPIWATGFARVILRQPVRGQRALAIGLGLAGAAVVLGFEGGMPLPRAEGEWFALAAGVLFALAATLTRRAGEGGGFEKTFTAFAAAAVSACALLVLAPVGTAPAPAELWRALPLLAGITVLWLLPQTWSVIWGAERLDPGRVSLLMLLEIVAAAASAALFAGEPFGWRELAGCVLILGAGAVEALGQPRPASAA
jgi:drug/metabolite transporter (DMT)-like permease